LESYKTGYKAKNFDVEDMSDFIIQYFEDQELRKNMKKAIKSMVIEKCSIGHMEKGLINAVNYCFKK